MTYAWVLKCDTHNSAWEIPEPEECTTLGVAFTLAQAFQMARVLCQRRPSFVMREYDPGQEYYSWALLAQDRATHEEISARRHEVGSLADLLEYRS